jgi:hypothetical protein
MFNNTANLLNNPGFIRKVMIPKSIKRFHLKLSLLPEFDAIFQILNVIYRKKNDLCSIDGCLKALIKNKK